MALGAADSPDRAYWRGYYCAKELRAAGVNILFAPNCDLLGNFLCSGGIRNISDDTDRIIRLIPDTIRGMKDAGILATAKHYPGHPKEYRDPHFSMCENNTTLEECGTIPLNPDGIHRAAVIALSPDDRFHEGLSAMIAAFS